MLEHYSIVESCYGVYLPIAHLALFIIGKNINPISLEIRRLRLDGEDVWCPQLLQQLLQQSFQ